MVGIVTAPMPSVDARPASPPVRHDRSLAGVDIPPWLELRAVVVAGLGAAHEFGFFLGGSAALIGRGIAARRTDAADWSSTIEPAGSFDAAVAAVTDRLQQDGFTLRPVEHSETFFKFGVATADDEAVEVRMGLDWRRCNPVEILMAWLATALPLSTWGMLQPMLRQIYRYDDRRSFLYGFDSDDVTDVRRVSSAVGDSLNDAAVTAFVVPDQDRRGALPITPSRRQRRAPLLALLE